MKHLLQLRLIVTAPPAGVAFAVQRGRSELLAPSAATAESLVFDFPIAVADATSDPPRLTGEFAQGPPGGRFVYVNSGTYAGQTGTQWSRRAKVPLSGISTAQIEAALAKAAVLQASIRGTGKDGGPACASVPLSSAWSVVA
ncbi:DUF5990 family protein [Lysobacter silvisoli]|nr:DUF5990 family protein [Lysobacter silvisoli]